MLRYPTCLLTTKEAVSTGRVQYSTTAVTAWGFKRFSSLARRCLLVYRLCSCHLLIVPSLAINGKWQMRDRYANARCSYSCRWHGLITISRVTTTGDDSGPLTTPWLWIDQCNRQWLVVSVRQSNNAPTKTSYHRAATGRTTLSS